MRERDAEEEEVDLDRKRQLDRDGALTFGVEARIEPDSEREAEDIGADVAGEMQVEEEVVVSKRVLRDDRRDGEMHSARDSEEVVADAEATIDGHAEAAVRVQPANYTESGKSEKADTGREVEAP